MCRCGENQIDRLGFKELIHGREEGITIAKSRHENKPIDKMTIQIVRETVGHHQPEIGYIEQGVDNGRPLKTTTGKNEDSAHLTGGFDEHSIGDRRHIPGKFTEGVVN